MSLLHEHGRRFRQLIVKAVEEVISNDAVLSVDPELQVSGLSSSKFYRCHLYVLYESSGVANIRLGCGGTIGVTYSGVASYLDTSGNKVAHSIDGIDEANTQFSADGQGAGTGLAASIAWLTTNTPTVKPLFAQATAEVSDTKVKVGSFLLVEEVG